MLIKFIRLKLLKIGVFSVLLFLPSCWIWIIIDSNNPKYSKHWHISKKRFKTRNFKLYRKGLKLQSTNIIRIDGIYIGSVHDKSPKSFVFDRFFKSGHYISCTYECKENCPPLDSLREEYVRMFRYGYYSIQDDGKVIVETHDNVIGMRSEIQVYKCESDSLRFLYNLNIKTMDKIDKVYSLSEKFLPITFELGYKPNW